MGDDICVTKQDLVLGIDSSGSLKESGWKILKGFAALGPIRPGASDWNVFRLRDRDVSYFTPDLGWVRASGLTAQVAESSRDVKASIKLQTYASGRYI